MKNIFGIICIALIWGCTSPRYVYTPSAVNNPFLREKGEGEINAMYSTSTSNGENGGGNSNVNGVDLMGSYVLTNNFGLQAHYFYRDEKDVYSLSWPNETLDGTIKYNRNELEFGIGGFVPLEMSKSIILSGWAGVGFGSTDMDESSQLSAGASGEKIGALHYKTTRLFFQPSVNFVVSDLFKAGLVSKFSSLGFKDVSTDFNELELMERYLEKLEGNNISLWEAGYNISFGFRGFKNVLFTHQLTFAGSSNDYYDLRPLNFSIGLSYVFKPKQSKKNVKSE
jgi:hypothetical protein